MISLSEYWKGRDKAYVSEVTHDIRLNAAITVDRVNQLLLRAGLGDIEEVTSGWRPRIINSATSKASERSKHLTAQAMDVADADRKLANWCVENVEVLEELGLWMEDPRWTPTWVHLQTVPPLSGNRIYIPSVQPPADPGFPVTWA